MYIRIARFEGDDPARLDESIARVRETMAGGPPPGLEGARRAMMLVDRETGTGLGVTFFDDEDSLRRGDETLNAMSRPDAGGRRSSVEIYEVAIDREF